jgi:cysteine desulfurase
MAISEPIYLDHNATTEPAPEVCEMMIEAMQQWWANPSSMHRAGQIVRQKVELAREAIARLINGQRDEITFTSGGTEAANLAIWSALGDIENRNVIVTSRVEHAAVHEMLEFLAPQGIEVIELGNDGNGIVDLEELESLLKTRHAQMALVTVMWANNVTGVIEPVQEIGRLCRAHGVRFHSDATQWVGKMPADITAFEIDAITFAGHKFHGPKGTGALWQRSELPVRPLVMGGPQERAHRGGTENVPGILGFGVAADLVQTWLKGGGPDRMAAIQIEFEACVLQGIPEACVIGAGADRHWSTTSIGFPDVESELMLLMLSERGVYASAGSACSSGALEAAKVIEALGLQPCQLTDRRYGSIRFSISRETTSEELKRAAEIIIEVVSQIHTMHARETV